MPDIASFSQTGAVRTFRPTALAAAPGDGAVTAHAHAMGFAAGYAAGAAQAALEASAQAERVTRAAELDAAEAAQQLRAGLAVLAQAAQAVRALVAPVLSDATTLLHEGALELAADVLGVELADDDASARAALARVLAAEPGPGPVTVHLHPRDLAALSRAGEDEPAPGYVLVADTTLAPGDAVATYADGSIDARIGAAVERARAALSRAGDGS